MHAMQLEALKVFCDIAVFHSFSKAAEANGLGQPAVSRIVHLLEGRLGGALVDRSKRPLQLTALGQTYYEGCKRLLEQYFELEASLARGHAERVLTVRVAAIYSVGLGDMGQYVERFEAKHRHARAHIEYVHPNKVYERVLDGMADFGLVSFPRPAKELTILSWRDEEMVVACPPHHPVASLSAVPPARLDGEKFVAFDKGLVIRREVDRFLREHGATAEIALELDNIESIKKGIEEGIGLALLPEPMLRQEAQAGTIRIVKLQLEPGEPRFVRPLGIIHRRHHQLGNAALGFIEQLRANGSGASHNSNGQNRSEDSPTPPANGRPGTAAKINGTPGARKKRIPT
jgi:DNA-binding transcriptional LysR family regulator